MGTFSIWHWLIVLVVVLILFGGGGKLSRLMGDFGKGLKSFKKQVKDDADSDEPAEPTAISGKKEAEATASASVDASANMEKDRAAKG